MIRNISSLHFSLFQSRQSFENQIRCNMTVKAYHTRRGTVISSNYTLSMSKSGF